MSMAIASGEKSGSDAGGGSGGGGVFLRSDFETTPLFVGRRAVEEGGTATFTLELPDNVATFAIRAVVVAPGSRFGSAETAVVSRRDVSLLPSLPRVLRPGDRCEACTPFPCLYTQLTC